MIDENPIEETPTIIPPVNKNKTRIIAAIIAAALIVVSLPVAIFLVKQRQEIRKQAEGECEEGQFQDRCEGECTSQGKRTQYKVTYRCNAQGEWVNTGMQNCDPMFCCPDNNPANCPDAGGPPPGKDCCSGTPECPDGQQCIQTDDPDCSTCQPMPGNLPGCCNGPNDCAHWEACVAGNDACDSNKSCRSQAGCDPAKGDSDCLPGNKCVNGTCVGENTLECHADENGVQIVNNTGQTISGTVNWYSSRCDSDTCFCSGSPSSADLTGDKALDPGESWSQNITGSGCSWQSDVQFAWCSNANNGCIAGCGDTPTSTPTPTPTVPTNYAISCKKLAAYDEDWQLISNLNTISTNDTVYFVVEGLCDEPQSGISDARFRINSGSWQNPNGKKWDKFYYQYAVAKAGNYKVEAMVSNPILGWR